MRTRLILAVVSVAAVTRLAAWSGVGAVFPHDRLYVDEQTYVAGSDAIREGTPFERPPGMYLLAAVLTAAGIPAARAVMSAVSVVPAVAMAAFARTRRGALFSVLAAMDPFLVLGGLQLMPEAPAAALLTLAALGHAGGRRFRAGLLFGLSCLFRAEILLVGAAALVMPRPVKPPVRSAAGALAAILPVLLWNTFTGAGPVLGANGAENLWLGSRIDLLTTPPGVEFEQLVAIRDETPGFLERAWLEIGAAPGDWVSFALRKASASMALPGPGRNLETGRLMASTGLALLLPATAAALLAGMAGAFGRRVPRLSRAALPALLAASALFFPAARHRTALLPLLYIASMAPLPRRESFRLILPAVAVGLSSLFPMRTTRPGLNDIVAASAALDAGDAAGARRALSEAAARGYSGADLHNLTGIATAVSGRPLDALAEFEAALETAPGSPTLWRNYAVALAGCGSWSEARRAAVRAVQLDPGLTGELEQLILEAE